MEKYYGLEMVAETCLFANILLNLLLCVQQNKGIDAHDDKTVQLASSNHNEDLNLVILRMQTMARSVVWSRGRMLDPETANEMLDQVSEFLDHLESLTQQHVPQGYSAPLVRGSSGRPRFSITEEQLRFLIEYNFSTRQMAEILCVSRRTVKRRLREYRISLRDRYTDLSDSDLDNRVRELVGGNDELGAESVWARLAGQGIVVQRHRVRQSLIRTNPVGATQRVTTRRLHRRVFQVAGPNSLWHLDGNNKLIRWRIVIHGGIDGYSRLVVFLKASSNNRSDTVFQSFVEAIDQYGLPSRVRCDNGGENNAVCLFMNVFRGFTRGSALRGRSTHNQRIEGMLGGRLVRHLQYLLCLIHAFGK
uniref:Integrase catalytic domain-containing protein n=2 Tax=Cyprinus carpio TaxID=7962 RepID=A0A8C2AGH5_CYPCA